MNKRHLLLANKICTFLFYPSFGVLLLVLLVQNHPDFLRTVLTCGISFGAVSAYRHWRNAPRPYETDPTIAPPTPNCRSGHSFPSRHVFCAWVIAVAFFNFSPILGIILALPATLLAYLRQKLCFHHKRDVVWGAIIGILSGVLGFWVL